MKYLIFIIFITTIFGCTEDDYCSCTQELDFSPRTIEFRPKSDKGDPGGYQIVNNLANKLAEEYQINIPAEYNGYPGTAPSHYEVVMITNNSPVTITPIVEDLDDDYYTILDCGVEILSLNKSYYNSDEFEELRFHSGEEDMPFIFIFLKLENAVEYNTWVDCESLMITWDVNGVESMCPYPISYIVEDDYQI